MLSMIGIGLWKTAYGTTITYPSYYGIIRLLKGSGLSLKSDVLYQTAKRKILDALPDILFFLFLFYAILVLFGVQYVIVVSFVTLLYKIRRKRKQTPRRLCIMFFVQMALSILAFLASHSLLACVLLNIAVPFLLVFLQSSQFNQKGYMASAMGFVFLQLRPIPIQIS